MLQAKIDGKWQPMPQAFMPKLPKDGGMVTFEYTHSFIEPANGQKSWRNQEQLRNPIRIKNPDGKGSIEIGLLGSIDQQGNPVANEVRRIILSPKASAGIHAITMGSSIDADDLAAFMLLSSENAASEYKDAGVEPIFRTKDREAEAKAEIAAMELEQEVMSIALGLKGTALTEMALLVGVDSTGVEAQKRARVADFARKNADLFLKLNSDPDKDAKATLGAGLANGTLNIDETQSAIVYTESGSVILPLTGTSRDEAMEQWGAYIRTDKNGAKTLQAVKNFIINTDKKNK